MPPRVDARKVMIFDGILINFGAKIGHFGIPPPYQNLSKIERKAFFVVMLSTAKVFHAGVVRKLLKTILLEPLLLANDFYVFVVALCRVCCFFWCPLLAFQYFFVFFASVG